MTREPHSERDEADARRRTEQVIGRPLPRTLHCSFCGKSQHIVKKLIAGPRGVFICDECVGLCDLIIAGHPLPPYAGFKPLEQATEALLDMLPSVDLASDANREFLQNLVEALRAREVSWADIGAALGVSRQSAWERFS